MESSVDRAFTSGLEVWGGIECTVNRVGDRYYDQVELTGHADRPDDLARVAALGIRRLRYPVLWERVAPESPDRLDWRWTDAPLRELRALGMSPIAGLVHHGSGPVYRRSSIETFPISSPSTLDVWQSGTHGSTPTRRSTSH